MERIERCLDDMYEDFFQMDYLYGEFAKRYGESYHSMSILYLLGEHPEGISQKQLAAVLYLPKQTVGSIMAGLERRGLAEHRQDDADRRSKLHALTAEGARHCDEMMDALRAIEMRCVEEIGVEDMTRAHDISTRYLALFGRELESNEPARAANRS